MQRRTEARDQRSDGLERQTSRPNGSTKRQHREAVVEAKGMASGHLVLRSTTMNKYSQPPETGRGPTRSTCRWLNFLAGTGICWTGALLCKVTLERWQIKHSLDQERVSVDIDGHKKRQEDGRSKTIFGYQFIQEILFFINCTFISH